MHLWTPAADPLVLFFVTTPTAALQRERSFPRPRWQAAAGQEPTVVTGSFPASRLVDLSLLNPLPGLPLRLPALGGKRVDKVEAGSKLVGDAGASMDDIVAQVQ